MNILTISTTNKSNKVEDFIWFIGCSNNIVEKKLVRRKWEISLLNIALSETFYKEWCTENANKMFIFRKKANNSLN